MFYRLLTMNPYGLIDNFIIKLSIRPYGLAESQITRLYQLPGLWKWVKNLVSLVFFKSINLKKSEV